MTAYSFAVGRRILGNGLAFTPSSGGALLWINARYSAAATARCLRCPYRVMPGGLYTDSTVSTINTTRAALEAVTIKNCRSWRLAPNTVVFVAAPARRSIGCVCTSKTMIARIVIRSFSKTQ